VHKESHGFVDGPAISDLRGRVLTCSSIDDTLHEVLEEIWGNHQYLYPATVSKKDDIRTSYQAFRSFRRSSATRAIEKRVSPNDIDVVNRWHAVDAAGGKSRRSQCVNTTRSIVCSLSLSFATRARCDRSTTCADKHYCSACPNIKRLFLQGG
jgi:hypothetical protein